jgi:hypothetical protein
LQPSESERVEKLQFHCALRLTVDRGWARSAPEIGSQQARDKIDTKSRHEMLRYRGISSATQFRMR